MGGSESKEGPKAKSPFSEEEKKTIEHFYHKNFQSKENFVKQSVLPSELSEKLYDCIRHLGSSHPGKHAPPSAGPTLMQYHAFLTCVLRGSGSDKARVLYQLCKDGGGDTVTGQEVFKTVMHLIEAYKAIVTKFPHFKNVKFSDLGKDGNKRLCLYCLRDLFSQEMKDLEVPENFSCGFEDLETWIYKSPLFGNILDTVFTAAFPVEHERQLLETLFAISPVPEIPAIKLGAIPSILDAPTILFLNHNLQSNLQCEWRLLFSNHLHGDSFAQLISMISNKGPSLMVIRDKGGYVFGGFASHSWECKAKFYGEPTCFLFSSTPQFGVYTATMYNENFMYLNQGQETLPNGLGMGGQFSYCGFWIDDTFNTGHSKAKPKNTTYGSPQLSSSAEFEVDTIEVWAVGREPKSDSDEEAEEEKPKKSILDRDPESKAMLELLGKHQTSEGMRERDEKEEETEEMRKKMNTIPKLL